MATPIVESVAVNLLAAINTVTTDNLYHETIVVKRQSRDDVVNFTLADRRGFLLAAERRLSDEQGAGKTTWDQAFLLMVVLINDADASVPIDTRLNQVAGDVEKAIMADPTLSGVAIWLTVDSVAFADDETGAMTLFEMQITVGYRTKRGDPYTV